MFFKKRQLTPKARRFLAIGNLCLVAGLMLTLFGNGLGLPQSNLLDGLRGFLLGLAITFNFYALRLARSRPNPLA
jgi:hypothetical protein